MEQKLPSAFQLHDIVNAQLEKAPTVIGCKVIGIKFALEKTQDGEKDVIHYDLEAPEGIFPSYIYNLDESNLSTSNA